MKNQNNMKNQTTIIAPPSIQHDGYRGIAPLVVQNPKVLVCCCGCGEEIRITREEEYFPPPRNIRQLQSGIENAALTMIGAPVSAATSVDDRLVSASDVLSSLD